MNYPPELSRSIELPPEPRNQTSFTRTMQTGQITHLAQSAVVLVLHGSPVSNFFFLKNQQAPRVSFTLYLSLSYLFPQSAPLSSPSPQLHHSLAAASQGQHRRSWVQQRGVEDRGRQGWRPPDPEGRCGRLAQMTCSTSASTVTTQAHFVSAISLPSSLHVRLHRWPLELPFVEVSSAWIQPPRGQARRHGG